MDIKLKLNVVVLAFVSILSISGCMGGAGNVVSGMGSSISNMMGSSEETDNTTDAEQAEADDQTRTRVEGTLIGMGVGALAGNLIGNDTSSTLIGTAIGGGVGYLVADEVARRKKEYKTKEKLIAAETSRTAELIKETQAINRQLKKEIGATKKAVATLQQQVKQGKAKQTALKAQKAAVDKRYKEAQQALTVVEKELEVTTDLYEDAKTEAVEADEKALAQWQNRIAQLKQEKNTLQTHTQQLESVSSAIAV